MSTSATSNPAPLSKGLNFVQLARTPLVPERVLRSYGAYCAIDTRFRAAARLLQCLWLKDNSIPTALSTDSTSPFDTFGSILSAEAAHAGKNFLNEDIHRLALQEWLLCEEDAAIDDERLFGNALSSMPLVFNLFGPLSLNRELATAVFRALLPDFVQDVDGIMYEHSPGRRKDNFLSDRTAFDLAVHVTTTDGHPAIIYCETKFSESLHGPAARMRDRYDDASQQVRLYRDPAAPILRSLALEQLWREHMLAQLAVENKVTPRAVFMAVTPRLNRRVQAALRVYQSELLDVDHLDSDRVAFVPLTLESFVEALAVAGSADYARALWSRYCDFDRVYRLSLQEVTGSGPLSRSEGAISAGTPALPATRRAPTATNERLSKAAALGAARRASADRRRAV
ncbi:PGN_0703 family putative restriction endonuclease [Bradyrhizobium elkanii]|uniref:PGN_0703 family putative restriction endonuclease n=1 Tax=Bradyrhizobium elkanii TaxID=29448 RepID=UPI0004B05012|nr:hypothetical protein [Bradyrhizobium elkanii]